MWFRAPKNCSAISVGGLQFNVEIVDKDGFGFFQAPESFSGAILAGTDCVLGIPDINITQKPQIDPAKTILTLKATIARLEKENQELVQLLKIMTGNMKIEQDRANLLQQDFISSEMKLNLARQNR